MSTPLTGNRQRVKSESSVTIAIGIDKVKTSDKNIAQAKRDSEVSQKPTSAELTG